MESSDARRRLILYNLKNQENEVQKGFVFLSVKDVTKTEKITYKCMKWKNKMGVTVRTHQIEIEYFRKLDISDNSRYNIYL